jgi:hypothetical protein
LADEAKDEAKDAAKTTATAAEEEAREAGKAFQGLKYFLEYGVKESVSAAGAAAQFRIFVAQLRVGDDENKRLG